MADASRQVYDMGIASGIPAYQMQSIMEKASRGEAMQTPTPQKQAVYDAYQNYYKQEITNKAQAGQALQAPNQWKNDMYNQALQAAAQQNAQAPIPQQQAPQQAPPSQGMMDINAFMQQSQSDSAAKMQSLQQFLQQSAQAQLQAQQAQLGMARDQQIAEIDRALQQAVANGEMSVREAEKQYNVAKEQINQQAYIDSEHTSLQAQNRGIQNSAQMIGLMQGDNARQGSLLNQNLTTRDEQVNNINNQLQQMEFNAGIDKSIANSQYNHGVAGAQGQIYGDMFNNMANLSYEEFARLQAQQSQFQQLGLQQQFNLENMSMEQQYALAQMAQSQGYNLQNMSMEQMYQLQQMGMNQNYTNQNMQTQQGFDMQKLSTQQKYTLEQMAKAQGYDLEKLTAQQQYTLAQMAQSFGYDMSLQSSQQGFQAGQNALDRDFEREIQTMRQDHDFSMLNFEQQQAIGQYDIELARKLRSVTPGTDEYKVLEGEADWAYKMITKENQANFAAEIGATELGTLLAQYPTSMPDPTDQKAVDAYNSSVERVNKQIQKLVGTQAGEQYIRDLAKSKGKSEEESGGFVKWIKDLADTLNPMTYVRKAVNNAFTP